MSTYRTVNVNQRPPQLVDSAFYADIRFDPDDSAPDYVGLHLTNGADTTDTNWKIYKFSYTGTNAERIQVAYGTWTGRAALFT